MAKILIAWELGGGLGHLTPLVPIVERLRASGHQVFAAVRDLSGVNKVFRGLGVACLQAPIKISKHVSPVLEPRNFSQILYNSGFSDPGELLGLAGGWRTLMSLFQPDLIVCDHAPIALLAARDSRARRASIGTGFCCPPAVSPFPDLRPWLPNASAELRRNEELVLQNTNAVLDSWQLKPLNQVSQLYGDVDRTFLTTLPELDHYPDRGAAKYYGTWLTPGGGVPDWPAGKGRRIFAYLKPFKTLPELLEAIQRTGCPALIYVDEIDAALRERFENSNMRFARQRLDLAAVSASCDIAILNGGHNATCLMLLAGKPVMTVPLNLEQAYNGSSVAKLDAGFGAYPENPDAFVPTLADVLESEKYRRGAERFAAKYANWSLDSQIAQISEQLHQIAGGENT